MLKTFYACIDKDMVSRFYFETHSELDMQATHHETQSYKVTDHFEARKSSPFTAVFPVSYKNQEGDIHIISSELTVNNDSFFE